VILPTDTKVTRTASRLLLFWLVLHFVLLILVSSAETFALIGQGLTISPPKWNWFWEKAARMTEKPLGGELAASNPVRQSLQTYLHCAGIETGYGYFAPNVPDSCRLVFELHYADGRVEYELPQVASSAAGLRIVSLLERLVRPDFDPFRKLVVQRLAASVWSEHPGVLMVRAVISSIRLPDISDYEKGGRESYEVLYAYELTPSVPGESRRP
jgi:hypothetical protein